MPSYYDTALYYPEDGGSRFSRNDGTLASYTRGYEFLKSHSRIQVHINSVGRYRQACVHLECFIIIVTHWIT
jgi:hypothetical protein